MGIKMHTVTFYPVGNGDTSLIETINKKFILMDYHQTSNSSDTNTPEYDIKTALTKKIKDAKKKSFDVVAFTHADKDHISGSTEFFYLEHANKYQGEGRIPIDELWVPAAMLLETTDKDHQSEECVIWRQEARHRLKNKSGIKVFSKPESLISLIESWDMTIEELDSFIIDAGVVLKNFTLENDGIEFFVHSPFMKHCNEGGKDIKRVRNDASLIFNVRFLVDGQKFDYLAIGDSTAEALAGIVTITRIKKNNDRLAWDLFKIPHHCSYLALAENKGETETTPIPEVKELLMKGKKDAYLICSSQAFLSGKVAEEQTQPPHIQARRCYERYLKEVKGRKFMVTGENGGTKKPDPVVVNIQSSGITIKTIAATAAIATAAATPTRAG